MHFSIILWFVLTTAIMIRVLLSVSRRRLARWKAIRHGGCMEPPSYAHQDCLGRDLSKRFAEAYKQHNFLDFTEKLFEEHGSTFKTIQEGKTVIRTKDPRVSKAVYSKFFDRFGLQPIRWQGGTGFFGDGILVTDGPRWKLNRALIRPAFDVAHIANFDRLDRHVSRFLELLPRDGTTVDLLPLFKQLTLDLSSEFIFGKSIGALSSTDSCREFIVAFNAAQRGVVIPPSARDENWEASCKLVTKYVDERVDEAIARVSSDSETASKSTEYVKLVDELAKVTQDRRTLRYQVINVFSPAHDTVAVTLGNLFFHLARNPAAWNSLRREILPTAHQPITYALLNSYKCLNWALRETHRLTPIAPASQRECLESCVIPSGGGYNGQSSLFVDAGDIIETNFRLMQRDKNFWGSDAEEFRPERWEHIRPTWEYTPFSGGPRICPAFKLVYTECEYITVAILRAFSRLENRDLEANWIEQRRLIYESKNGTLVGLVP